MQTLSNLAFDDEPNAQQVVETSDNRSHTHRLWDYVHSNPNSSVAQIAAAFGRSRGDTSSLMSQMLKRGLVARQRVDGVFYFVTLGTEYPVYTLEQRTANLSKHWGRGRQTSKRRHKAGRILVKREDPPVASAPAVDAKAFTAAEFLSRLNVMQAKAVYEELKKLFGG